MMNIRRPAQTTVGSPSTTVPCHRVVGANGSPTGVRGRTQAEAGHAGARSAPRDQRHAAVLTANLTSPTINTLSMG